MVATTRVGDELCCALSPTSAVESGNMAAIRITVVQLIARECVLSYAQRGRGNMNRRPPRASVASGGVATAPEAIGPRPWRRRWRGPISRPAAEGHESGGGTVSGGGSTISTPSRFSCSLWSADLRALDQYVANVLRGSTSPTEVLAPGAGWRGSRGRRPAVTMPGKTRSPMRWERSGSRPRPRPPCG